VTPRTDPAFFEAKYRTAPGHDPWRFADDADEQRRYRTLDELLGTRRFRAALEPGCSIGVFTRRLAERSGEVDAIDVASTAVAEASRRNADLPTVHHEVGRFPEWALARKRRYDLVCLVEIGYYVDADRLRDIAQATVLDLLAPGGTILLSHWTGHSDDHVISGDEVHRVVGEVLGCTGLARADGPVRRPHFVAEVWELPAIERHP
jgi:SAM-dependent methyltransferase